jgi:hypothetical protein
MNSIEIKRLLERYYEASSSSEEETILREYFNGGNIPHDLEKDMEIFRYFIKSAEIPEPSPDFEKRIISAIDYEEKHAVVTRKRRFYSILSGIAAGMLIFAGSLNFFRVRSEAVDTYSDPQIAYEVTMKILYQVSSQLNYGTKTLRHLKEMNDETGKIYLYVNKSASMLEDNIKPPEIVFNPKGNNDGLTDTNY